MKLLKELYEVYSPSGGEKKIKRYIKRWVGNNVRDAVIRKDNQDGNIYITRGKSETYPCVVAHLDQVQKNHSHDFKAVETEDIIFGYSPSKRSKEGLGADDKNGIWIALKCLEEFDCIKVAFFVGEEVGCVGSGRCDISWFGDCRYIIEPDRRGAHDLITNISGRICSVEFENAIDGALFGYVPTAGMMTDVLELGERGVGLSCINLSCGYYEPHTDDEYTVKIDLINCLNFVRHIIRNVTDVYPYEYSYSYRSVYSSYYNGYKTTSLYKENSYTYYERDSKIDTWKTPPSLIYIREYADLDSYVDQLMWQNFEHFTPDELWPYIESDLATYEISEDDFLKLAWDYYEFYVENSSYDEEDYYQDWYGKKA